MLCFQIVVVIFYLQLLDLYYLYLYFAHFVKLDGDIQDTYYMFYFNSTRFKSIHQPSDAKNNGDFERCKKFSPTCKLVLFPMRNYKKKTYSLTP